MPLTLTSTTKTETQLFNEKFLRGLEKLEKNAGWGSNSGAEYDTGRGIYNMSYNSSPNISNSYTLTEALNNKY